MTAKNPGEATIVKMLQLASRLGARVFGDDDEEYIESPQAPGFVIPRSDELEHQPEIERPWWKFW